MLLDEPRLALTSHSVVFFGGSDSLGHGASLVQMSLEVAFLHESSVAMLAVEGLLAAMHPDVGSDAEDLRVGPWTL